MIDAVKHIKSYWSSILFVPPIIYYSYFLHYAINVPVGDDFLVILKFLIDWDWAHSIADKWNILTANFIEHRLVYTRLSALLVRFVLGQLDFRAIMILGNLCLLGILWLLGRPLVSNKLAWGYSIPISLLLFQPIAYEGNFWAIAATNYMPVCFFSMLCMFLLSSQHRFAIGMALLVGTAATLTFANGLLVWPTGCIVLLIQRRFTNLLWWSSISILVITLYFVGYRYDNQPDILPRLTAQLPAIIATFFLMIGAFVNPDDKIHRFALGDYSQLVVGVLLCGWIMYALVRLARPFVTNSQPVNQLTSRHIAFLIGCSIFLLLSCACFAVGRSAQETVITESRYRNFSLFLVALGYVLAVLVAPPISRPKVSLIGLLGAALFCISSYLIYTPRLEMRQTEVKAGVYNWAHNQYWLIYRSGGYYNTVADTVSHWVDQYSLNWYQFPPYLSSLSVPTAKNSPSDTTIRAQIDSSQAIKVLHLEYPNPTHLKGEPYGLLLSSQTLWLFNARHPVSIRHLISHGHYQTPHIFSELPLHGGLNNDLPEGDYQVGIALVKHNKLVHVALKPNFTVSVRSTRQEKKRDLQLASHSTQQPSIASESQE